MEKRVITGGSTHAHIHTRTHTHTPGYKKDEERKDKYIKLLKYLSFKCFLQMFLHFHIPRMDHHPVPRCRNLLIPPMF